MLPLGLERGLGEGLIFVEKVTNGCLCGTGSTLGCFHPKLYMMKLKVIKAFRVCSSSALLSLVRVSTFVNELSALTKHLGGKRHLPWLYLM